MPKKINTINITFIVIIILFCTSSIAFAEPNTPSTEIVDLQLLMYDTIRETYPKEITEYQEKQDFPSSSDKLHNVMTSEYKESNEIYKEAFEAYLEPFEAPKSSLDLRQNQLKAYKNSQENFSDAMSRYDTDLKALHSALPKNKQ